ncbi:hypothetical protein Bca4012_084496 [Brassica carinata]
MTESIWSHDQPSPPPSHLWFLHLNQWLAKGLGASSGFEAESLQHLSANYCPLVPPPRSTIAAADGRTLASTHSERPSEDTMGGEYFFLIALYVINFMTSPGWMIGVNVVRFHPRHSEIVASGSLDHEVRLWNAKISDLMISVNRPIASIAFHAEGDILAVASGHKVWHSDKTGEDSTPAIVLKTRRSLRAVHFHPHGIPLLLTAEVTDIDSSDSALTRATSPGYLRYPPPAIFFTNTQSGGSHTSMSFECKKK